MRWLRSAAPAIISAVSLGVVPAALGVPLFGNSPPLCVPLLTPATVAKVFHVPHMSAANWHTDGVAQDYCDYAPSANAGDVQTQVDDKATTSYFQQQIKVAEAFGRSKPVPVPALGPGAVDVPLCAGLGCTPNVLVLAKGYYITVSDVLATASMKSLPEVEQLVKDLIAKV